MNKQVYRTFKLRFLIVSCLLATVVYGQEFQYEGKYQMGTYLGQARFGYDLVEKDTVLQGPFGLQRLDVSALLGEKDRSFDFTGYFTNGRPTGSWNFKFGEYATDSSGKIVGYQYHVNVNGIQRSAKGKMIDGSPDGLWSFSTKQIEGSQIQDTLFLSEFNFDKGVPQQNFVITNTRGTLIGRLLRNGTAHDTWTFFAEDDNTMESWYFDNGRLLKIEQQTNTLTEVLDIFGDKVAKTKTIDFDEGFMALIALYRPSMTSFFSDTSFVNKLLLENQRQYQSINTLFNSIGNADLRPNFQVSVPYFPLSAEALLHLKRIDTIVSRSSKISSEILNSTQVNLLKRSDKEAELLFQTTKAISSNYIQPLEALTRLHQMKVVAYLPKKLLIKRLFPNGKPTTTLTIPVAQNPGQEVTGPGATKYDFTPNSIQALSDMATYADSYLDSITVVLNKKLFKDQRKQELIKLEEQLIDQANELTQLIDTTKSGMRATYKKVLRHVGDTSDRLLSGYAEMTSGSEKITRAKSLSTCLEDLKTLATTIVSLEEKATTVDETYTDAVWNPFMANLMEEAVKKRLTTAYHNILIPYFLEQVRLRLDCENANALALLFESAFERMLVLREMETSKLERKLKREEDPTVVLRLFELENLKSQN